MRQMVDILLEVTGSSMKADIRPARVGDTVSVTADVGKINYELDWHARNSNYEIAESAWVGFKARHGL